MKQTAGVRIHYPAPSPTSARCCFAHSISNPKLSAHPLHIFQPHYNVRYPVLRWRPLLMRCQSVDNLLQQLDPHLLPLTFLFPSQDSLLMQSKLSATYLFADTPVCKAAGSQRRCAPPRLKCEAQRPKEMTWKCRYCDCLVPHGVISTVGKMSFIYCPSIPLLSWFFPLQLPQNVLFKNGDSIQNLSICHKGDDQSVAHI